jgi:ABC-2 type transport system permease protein
MALNFKNKKTQALTTVALVAVILILLNILATAFNAHFDLTEEKRFTLTKPTKSLVKNVDDALFVRVLLDGQFPAGFKRLQNATKELLEEFHGINSFIEYKFEDPSVSSNADEQRRRYEQLAEEGLVPTRLRVVDDKQKNEQYIFPYAELNYKGRKVIVKLLESDVPGQNQDVSLNNSVSLLEYKFANGIQKLQYNQRPNIVFTEGHDELKKEETADLEQSLRAFYNTGRINLDSLGEIPFRDANKRADILIIAKPKKEFSEKHKFQLDQYIMQGGKVIWLIDRLNAELVGMQKTGEMLPVDYPLNIEDMLFKYGARINPNLIVDMECSQIPLNVGSNQMDLFRWYYFPIAAPSTSHPIAKSLDRVFFQFPSSIDTIKTRSEVKKSIVLTSSKRSRLQFTPTKLNFQILRYPADPTKFDKPNQPIAVMLEGKFPSNYENRVTQEQLTSMKQIGMTFEPLSKPTKMLIVSDGDVARNEYDALKGAMLPLGLSRFDRYKYANKDFLLNTIEYMLDDNGIIEARSKDVKLRLIDTVKAKNDATLIQGVNILLPLIFLGSFGAFYYWRRRRKYAIMA